LKALGKKGQKTASFSVFGGFILMGLGYRRWVRANLLQEEPGPILSESILQRIWFEQLARNPLTTLAGEPIRLLHPGIWNHGPGPDFLRASFSTADGRVLTGDVEIHRHASDWCAHEHSANPAYGGVLLHVFWQAGPAGFEGFPPQIRQVALEHQLSAPLTELVPLFRSSPAEILTGERPGQCHPALLALPPEKLKEVLEEAGWYRLRQRRSLAQVRVNSFGFEQAVWIALAEGLGFSENREPFASLARAVPVRKLLALSDPLERAAILYGTAGLLPDPTRSKVSERVIPLLRRLWDSWWRLREDWAPYILPFGSWRLGGTRPNNSPYRRLAALSHISYLSKWQRVIESVGLGDAAAFLSVLGSISDGFWDQHAGWDGRILSSSSKLIGQDRAVALLFQVLAPLAGLTETELWERMESWPAGGDAGLLRSASVRLLGVPFPPPDVRTHLAREGLLQIYKDFCRAKPCAECSMVNFVKGRFS
jgi:hypothetical protein